MLRSPQVPLPQTGGQPRSEKLVYRVALCRWHSCDAASGRCGRHAEPGAPAWRPPSDAKHKHSVERAIVAMSDLRTVAVESKRLERECDTLATADAQRDYAAL